MLSEAVYLKQFSKGLATQPGKSYVWELEKIYRSQFWDQALTIFEQNNYQLSEEKTRAIEARVQRLELEDSSTNREVSNGAE